MYVHIRSRTNKKASLKWLVKFADRRIECIFLFQHLKSFMMPFYNWNKFDRKNVGNFNGIFVSNTQVISDYLFSVTKKYFGFVFILNKNRRNIRISLIKAKMVVTVRLLQCVFIIYGIWMVGKYWNWDHFQKISLKNNKYCT